MKNIITITELSSLTGKTRPTIYKYITLYDENKLNDIPYNFIELFNFIENNAKNKKDVFDYCQDAFALVNNDKDLNEIVTLLKKNKEKINLKDLYNELSERLKGEENG